jgi:hypothetical protein
MSRDLKTFYLCDRGNEKDYIATWHGWYVKKIAEYTIHQRGIAKRYFQKNFNGNFWFFEKGEKFLEPIPCGDCSPILAHHRRRGKKFINEGYDLEECMSPMGVKHKGPQ